MKDQRNRRIFSGRGAVASFDTAGRSGDDEFRHVALAAAMGGIDGLVFTAGIGERSREIRARVCERLDWLAGELDARGTVPGALLGPE